MCLKNNNEPKCIRVKELRQILLNYNLFRGHIAGVVMMLLRRVIFTKTREFTEKKRSLNGKKKITYYTSQHIHIVCSPVKNMLVKLHSVFRLRGESKVLLFHKRLISVNTRVL
jgi:hypothetical protein